MQTALSAAICGGLGKLAAAFADTAPASAVAAPSPMAQGRPSATAQGAALLRAAHQLLDDPKVFDDPLALRIIGAESEAWLRASLDRYERRRSLRAFVALRSRYAEDELARAVGEGVRQYVVLGAGLDTFAYRNPHAKRLRVFEVDHPATQQWKRRRLADNAIPVPGSMTFAPVDVERETLGAGFDAAEPAFFSMLGVAVYLTRPALDATLGFIASLPAGSEIVFSYSVPSSSLTETQRRARESTAKRVSARGEPWISYYDPAALQADLTRMGFSEVAELGPEEANERYFSERADGLRVSGSGRMIRARV